MPSIQKWLNLVGFVWISRGTNNHQSQGQTVTTRSFSDVCTSSWYQLRSFVDSRSVTWSAVIMCSFCAGHSWQRLDHAEYVGALLLDAPLNDELLILIIQLPNVFWQLGRVSARFVPTVGLEVGVLLFEGVLLRKLLSQVCWRCRQTEQWLR